MRRGALFFLFGIFFIFPMSVCAAEQDIIINEIAAYESSDYEWIELYNKGTTAVDITGWKFFENNTNHSLSSFRGTLSIAPGQYVIIANKADKVAEKYSTFSGTLIDSSWTSLNESGELVGLKNANGTSIEQFTYVSAPDHSLERKDANVVDYSAANWKEHASGNTIGIANSNAVQAGGQSQDSSSQNSNQQSQQSQTQEQPIVSDVLTSPWRPGRGDVLINEFVADPEEGEKEWIELYNRTSNDIELSGWTIENSSRTSAMLSGALGGKDSKKFFVVDLPPGFLRNGGDNVELRDARRFLIDAVTYGQWDDGDLTNNAPRAADPFSLARIGDGANTYYNKNDFQITSTSTRGTSNKITQEEVSQSSSTKQALIISEVLPNPASQNIDDEFIELYNSGESPLSLAGWTLTVSNGEKYIVPEQNAPRIEPKKYGTLFRGATHLALRNTGGDTVKLFSPTSERAIATLSYRDTAPLGMSYMLLSGANYTWTQNPTPGQANSEVHSNRAPEIFLEGTFTGPVGDPLSFDASDSSDPDKDLLTFEWSFGDGNGARGPVAQHMYQKDGSFILMLSVGDGEKRSIMTRTVKIYPDKEVRGVLPARSLEESPINQQGSTTLVLSEVVPNPKGADVDEFIELENQGNSTVALTGWKIMLPLQKREYLLPSAVSIAAHGFFTFTKKGGAFSLRNTKEQIVLASPDGKDVEEITYNDPPSGMSLSKRADELWEWTSTITGGRKNKFPKVQEDVDVSFALAPDKTFVPQKKNDTSQPSLEYVRTLRSGTGVHIQGVVSVEPGVLGEDKFYVAGSGIQIWNTNKQFPKLARGDRISVRGTIRKNAKEQSIKIAAASDVRVVSSGDAPEPHDVEVKDISDAHEGWLVRVAGTVQKMQWPNIYLENGDATTRVYIAKTTGIEKQEFQKGDTLAVVGIVSESQTGFRVLPRDEGDIVLSQKKSETVDQKDSSVSASEKREPFDKAKKGLSIVRYIIVAGLGLLIVLAGLFLEYLRVKKEKNR